jgi:FkbM family methyltransferase
MGIIGRLRYHLEHLNRLPEEVGRIPQRLTERAIYREIFINQSYYWLWENIKPNTTVIDIGAFFGETAIYFSMNPNVEHVYAYELMPNTYAFAKENIALNPFKDKITLTNMAVMAGGGTVNAPKDESGLGGRVVAKGLPVTAVGLNDILKGKRNVIIKCDVEGAETEIFYPKVDMSQVYRLMIEYHSEKGKSMITKVLTDQGFEVKAIVGGRADKLDKGMDEMGYICAQKAG